MNDQIETSSPPEITSDNQETPVLQGEIVQQTDKRPAWRPTTYDDSKLKIAQDYLLKCSGLVDGKKRLPILEELARLCGVDHETLDNWAEKKDENGNYIRPEFLATIKSVRSLQKETLVQKGMQMSNPTFAIFLLKANHGMIETEKRILAGERQGEPLQVSVTNYKDATKPTLPESAAQQILEEGSE